MLGSGNNLTRGVDVPPLPQCLPLEPIRLGNQKYTRSGELRRVLGVSSIISSEDSTFGVSCPKSSPPVVTGELKHFKERMQDTSREAGNRAKKLGESIFKLDKYAEVLTSKKRQRRDISPGEKMDAVNMDKVRSQIPDEKKKMFGLDKRAHTSVVDGDGRVSALLRQQVTEKDSDSLPGFPGETMRIEEKIQRLEAKTKRKRSVAALDNRVINSDRRGMQPKLIADSKLRSCDTQNYRFKSSAASGINRLDAFSRNELESVSFARDRSAFVEQRIMAKGNTKRNLKDNNLANSSSAALKGKVSRAPGTGAIMTAEPSSRVETPSRALQGSSPHAMAQWVGQRPHKNSRTRRTNVVSPFMKHTENKTSSQGFATSDFSSRDFPGTTGTFSAVDNTSLKVKRERKNTSSPYRLSESEGSEGGDNKPSEHGLENGEVTTTQKTGALLLPIRKNKIYSGHNGDCTWKQGKGGNSSSLITPGFHPITVKMENRPREKPIRNSKIATNKNKSKSGRPPTRKLKDRKASTRLGSNANAVSSDAAGESDDDCEDLFAAANSARKAANHACSGKFWKKMEYIFAPVSPDDMQYMKDQLSFVEELGESLREATTNVYNIMGVLTRKAPQGPGDDTADFSNQPSSISDLSFERMDMRKLNESTPLYKRVLSALIEEDNGEEDVEFGEVKNLPLHYASDDYHCGSCTHIDTETRERDRTESEVESSAEFQTLKNCLFDRFSSDMSIMSNSFRSVSVPIPVRSNEQWLGDDDLSHSKVALGGKICSNNPSQLQPREMIIPDFPSSETQYQFLSLDDRLLLELHSIGIYPEELPDLAEETISTDVLKLKEDVYQQIQNMKKMLGKINMTIQKSEDGERRKIEYLAMDQLVEMAHRKRVAIRGSKESKECKVSRQVAMAFIKRTVARCRKLEETGCSCFADPALQDVLFSSPGNDTKSSDKGGLGTGTARNSSNETSNHQVEARGSGAVCSSTKRGEALMDKATATSPDSGGHENCRKAKPRQENSNQPTGPASSNPEEEAFEEMALKELGSIEESGDMGNWFDGLQDIHTVGLEIPMDDLADVNLLL